MPLIENPGDYFLGSRFTFERDSSAPNGGLKDVGVYYTFVSGQTVAAAPGLLGLGLQGYLFTDPRQFGMEWNPIARSVPAPKYFGSFSQRTLKIKDLYYHGRTRNEVETFVKELPDRIGPWEGLIRMFNEKDFETLLGGWPQCFLTNVEIKDDGANNFVEYTLTFETNQKMLTPQELSVLNTQPPVYNPQPNLPEFFA